MQFSQHMGSPHPSLNYDILQCSYTHSALLHVAAIIVQACSWHRGRLDPSVRLISQAVLTLPISPTQSLPPLLWASCILETAVPQHSCWVFASLTLYSHTHSTALSYCFLSAELPWFIYSTIEKILSLKIFPKSFLVCRWLPRSLQGRENKLTFSPYTSQKMLSKTRV